MDIPYPYLMTRDLRGRLVTRYPALAARTKTGRRLLAMAAQLLHGAWYWPEEGEPYQRWSQAFQAKLMGVKWQGNCRSGEWLTRFSESVWPLSIEPYSYRHGYARRVRWSGEGGLADLRDEALGAVGFRPGLLGPDGSRVGQQRREEQLREYRAAVRRELWIADDHPAAALFAYLNGQDPGPYRELVAGNWGALWEAVRQLSPGPTAETSRRALHGIREKPFILYRPSPRTVRLHAVGPTVHLLRRDLRQLALSGAVTALDLRSSQLAIAAKLWGIDPLYDFLAARASIWTELETTLGLSPAMKSASKRAIYSAAYGMATAWIVRRLQDHREGEPGYPRAAALAFRRHPLIEALLAARAARAQQVVDAGGLTDPFGRALPLSEGMEPRELLAQENQAVELELMLAGLPALVAYPQVSVVSWLHDGLVLAGPADAREACATAFQTAVNQRAREQDIPTELERS